MIIIIIIIMKSQAVFSPSVIRAVVETRSNLEGVATFVSKHRERLNLLRTSKPYFYLSENKNMA